jgi:hypothetical protein
MSWGADLQQPRVAVRSASQAVSARAASGRTLCCHALPSPVTAHRAAKCRVPANATRRRCSGRGRGRRRGFGGRQLQLFHKVRGVRHRLGGCAADAFSGSSVRLSVGRHHEGGEEGGGGVAAAEHGSNQDHVTRHPALQHERVANWEQGQQIRVFAILEIHHEPIHVARAGELEGGAAERKDMPARVHVERAHWHGAARTHVTLFSFSISRVTRLASLSKRFGKTCASK